uniref:Uncharacterized protein n=1 Tax=Anguilla anguilla TaxID=7936 RepID=A0A0E9TSN2_ANGAN
MSLKSSVIKSDLINAVIPGCRKGKIIGYLFSGHLYFTKPVGWSPPHSEVQCGGGERASTGLVWQSFQCPPLTGR